MSFKNSLQLTFNNMLATETRPLNMQGVGTKPGRKRTQLVKAVVTDQVAGATVDVTPKDPLDGGPLVQVNSPLFSQISVEDINQGQLSDCYFLSTLQSLSNTPAGQAYLRTRIWLESLTRAVVMFQRGGTVTQLHLDLLISTEYAQFGPDKDIWVELMEKAYAFFRTGADTYASLNMGNPAAVMLDLGLSPGSNVATTSGSTDGIKTLLNAGSIVTNITPAVSGPANLVTSHSYSILSVSSDAQTVVLRNPWGKAVANPLVTLPRSQIIAANMAYYQVAQVPAVQPAPVVPSPQPPVPVPTPTPAPTVRKVVMMPGSQLPGLVPSSAVLVMTGGMKIEGAFDGTTDIGYIQKSDRAFFLVNVAAPIVNGALNFRVANLNTAGVYFSVCVNGILVGSVQCPITGAWQTFVSVPLTGVDLPAGNSVIEIVSNSAGWNLLSFWM